MHMRLYFNYFACEVSSSHQYSVERQNFRSCERACGSHHDIISVKNYAILMTNAPPALRSIRSCLNRTYVLKKRLCLHDGHMTHVRSSNLLDTNLSSLRQQLLCPAHASPKNFKTTLSTFYTIWKSHSGLVPSSLNHGSRALEGTFSQISSSGTRTTFNHGRQCFRIPMPLPRIFTPGFYPSVAPWRLWLRTKKRGVGFAPSPTSRSWR